MASWSIQPFGHNKHGPKIGGLCPLFGGGEQGPHLTQSRLGQVGSWSMQPFGRNRYGQKTGGLCPFGGGGAGSPFNSMWPGPRPTCMPSFILSRPTVWLQYTNVTDNRTDRTGQRSDRIGRTVLQTVAQKWCFTYFANLSHGLGFSI